MFALSRDLDLFIQHEGVPLQLLCPLVVNSLTQDFLRYKSDVYIVLGAYLHLIYKQILL